MTTVIVQDRVIRIRADRSASPQSMIVRAELDDGRSWVFDEPGWRELSFGVSGGALYWWSARRLVRLPVADEAGVPATITANEDIILAFLVGESWVLVCESSIRLCDAYGQEISRLEFGEVFSSARWEGDKLMVDTETGAAIGVLVTEGRLAVQPSIRGG